MKKYRIDKKSLTKHISKNSLYFVFGYLEISFIYFKRVTLPISSLSIIWWTLLGSIINPGILLNHGKIRKISSTAENKPKEHVELSHVVDRLCQHFTEKRETIPIAILTVYHLGTIHVKSEHLEFLLES